jgi:hypothetical protein
MSNARRRQQPEYALQTALVQHLRLRARPDVLWFHVANQRKADARTGAILKRMGALAGVSDIVPPKRVQALRRQTHRSVRTRGESARRSTDRGAT